MVLKSINFEQNEKSSKKFKKVLDMIPKPCYNVQQGMDTMPPKISQSPMEIFSQKVNL